MIGLRLSGTRYSAHLGGRSSSMLIVRVQNRTAVRARGRLLRLMTRSNAGKGKIIRLQAILSKYIFKPLPHRSLILEGGESLSSSSPSSTTIGEAGPRLGARSLAQVLQTHFAQSHSGRSRAIFIPATARARMTGCLTIMAAREINIGANSFDIRSIRFTTAFKTCNGGLDVGVASVGTC
jgi:hypothetical protein